VVLAAVGQVDLMLGRKQLLGQLIVVAVEAAVADLRE
jgi:hypothetical protein